MVAQQKDGDGLLEEYRDPDTKVEIMELAEGNLTKSEMFEKLQTEAYFETWLVRVFRYGMQRRSRMVESSVARLENPQRKIQRRSRIDTCRIRVVPSRHTRIMPYI